MARAFFVGRDFERHRECLGDSMLKIAQNCGIVEQQMGR
jgi:hypothetical protein